MNAVRTGFKISLIIAIVIYLIGTCLMLVDLYHTVGKIEHTLLHVTGEHDPRR